ncbi:MAG: hypothetical protein ABIK15_18695 [Pseudomonadota bacterium]
MKIRTCVSPDGYFVYGVHRPSFTVRNLRKFDHILTLGVFADGRANRNHRNFPEKDVTEPDADWIYEIPNPFSFRGTTYIARSWAEKKADNPLSISLPAPATVSFTDYLAKQLKNPDDPEQTFRQAFSDLPESLLLAIAETSTDPRDLVSIAKHCCEFVYDPDGLTPIGIHYQADSEGRYRAVIRHHDLFEVLVNNIFLPDIYKEVMVLKPGVQGDSEIVGEWNGRESGTHVYEYLRRNSYIPWGHYASNMAHDAIRYHIRDLSLEDISGLRYLYYQRNYVRMAQELNIDISHSRDTIPADMLENIRKEIKRHLSDEALRKSLRFTASLWGWNYGFDFAPSKYRLHASHQQIHQQFAMVPVLADVEKSIKNHTASDIRFSTYCCGDLIHDFIEEYRRATGRSFFEDYCRAIRSNIRMDGRDNRPSSLIVYEDEHVMLFVPKAQTSQWELQLMTTGPVGNILEADGSVRKSLDTAIWIAMRTLTKMGARMITTIEYSKRFDLPEVDQRLLVSFLPKLPESPGAFSEAQLRWINGHYPEDFAIACRANLPQA